MNVMDITPKYPDTYKITHNVTQRIDRGRKSVNMDKTGFSNRLSETINSMVHFRGIP